MPKVSVVMSTYHDVQYLGESIDSVLAQDFGDFEFIIVNDGSPDPRARKVLADYKRRDDRIRVIQKKNEGLTRALIDGCLVSTGEYIVRIDVGDVMTPDRVGKQMQILKKNRDCAFVSCKTEFCGPEWELLWVNSGRPASDVPVSILPKKNGDGLTGDIPHHGSVMFRRATYLSAGGYREQFYYGQDWDLWYRLAERGNYFVVPEILYRVRIFPRSISMTCKHYQDSIAEYSKGAFISRFQNKDEQPWIAKATLILPDKFSIKRGKSPKYGKEPGLYFIDEVLRRNGDVRSRRYFLTAIHESPFRLRSYIRLMQSYFTV